MDDQGTPDRLVKNGRIGHPESEPDISQLLRLGELRWYDGCPDKRPGEVIIHREAPLLYDFAQAVKVARSLRRWRASSWTASDGSVGAWAASVVHMEIDLLRTWSASKQSTFS
ncbi:hypothetical protein ACFQNJ_16160 [Hydrogenophaga bisanensis]|uniref:Uncharacterized protein n=1 Tax=Hydrogenophaga bisanensis TaxID=439611 RepID=A0ABW2RDB6_9BURK